MASMHRIIGTLSRVTCQTWANAPGRAVFNRTLKTDSSSSNSTKTNTMQVTQHHSLFQNHWMETVNFQQRHMSSKNFFQTVIDNAKQEFKKNKEMKESIAKFKEETQKLEESEALKQARKKFETIEEETLKSSTAIKKSLGDLKEKVAETVEEAQKSSEFVKKGMEMTSKTATKAAETIQKSGQAIGQSEAFKQISEGVKSAKEEFDEITLSRAKHYKAPEKLMKRSELSMRPQDKREVEADDESTGMVLHKDSRFYQSWQNFKDNNPYVNKLFDLKVKYDESDNVMVRATRFFTDKIGQVFGGMFTKTEMSEVLTEICKVDPDFNREKFIRLCETEIIPNILEAMIRGDLEVLKDWCFEAPYNTLAHPVEQAKKAFYTFDSKVLDVSHADIIAGKIMEQGPVLVINFNAQQIMVVRDAKGKVVEGDPDKILRIMYVWALCRDQEEFNPRAAWKLIDLSASSSEQWL
ncbi:mitochondrial import inner membrane translocase subunit TIM44 [Elysia marginata]|uniref:Mitochondrial import inner membrane translocase subunit TIM44 n=1 Tax=Elysia marginata TaxID=1093978 RepID=A0AAV4H9T8_9GAST|nr:mitochondrial import inner membrane translocase subunit TIM44 [Elysia marginata]